VPPLFDDTIDTVELRQLSILCGTQHAHFLATADMPSEPDPAYGASGRPLDVSPASSKAKKVVQRSPKLLIHLVDGLDWSTTIISFRWRPLLFASRSRLNSSSRIDSPVSVLWGVPFGGTESLAPSGAEDGVEPEGTSGRLTHVFIHSGPGNPTFGATYRLSALLPLCRVTKLWRNSTCT
jgi:hypothetical protein